MKGIVKLLPIQSQMNAESTKVQFHQVNMKGIVKLLPIQSQMNAESTKVLCPLFDETEILIAGVHPAFSHLWTKCYRTKKNDFIEAVHQT